MPFSGGRTVVTPNTKIKVEEEKAKFVVVEGGVTIRELVKALNAIGVSPRDMIDPALYPKPMNLHTTTALLCWTH